MSIERWMPAPNFPSYEVSHTGIVRRWVVYNRWWTMKLDYPQFPKLTPKEGYLQVHLSEPDGRKWRPYVHRLVLSTFDPVEGMENLAVRHLDGNPLNNWLYNLAWGSWKENADDRERHGRTSRGESHGRACRKEREYV